MANPPIDRGVRDWAVPRVPYMGEPECRPIGHPAGRPGPTGPGIEEFIEDGQYVVRAEIPGVGPKKEVDVGPIDGVLKIHLERTEEKRQKAARLRSKNVPSGGPPVTWQAAL